MKKRIILSIVSFLINIVLLGCLCACGAQSQDTTVINVSVLNGSTAYGAAFLMSKDTNETQMNFTIESDASEIMAGLVNGTVDIGALPTNAAANLYQKTNGGVQVIALNTLGVLYVVTDEAHAYVRTLQDLEGQTIYVPAQNPSFIFKAICAKSGVNVDVDTTYAQPAELRSALVAGSVGIAVLPEPMVTVALNANASLSAAINLTQAWDAASGTTGTLVQGCLVARTEFIENHPQRLRAFLTAYEDSVAFVNENHAEAGVMIEALNLTKAKIAENAIPRCNLCCITGKDVKTSLQPFLEALYAVNPASVGGQMPDDDFYYENK